MRRSVLSDDRFRKPHVIVRTFRPFVSVREKEKKVHSHGLAIEKKPYAYTEGRLIICTRLIVLIVSTESYWNAFSNVRNRVAISFSKRYGARTAYDYWDYVVRRLLTWGARLSALNTVSKSTGENPSSAVRVSCPSSSRVRSRVFITVSPARATKLI